MRQLAIHTTLRHAVEVGHEVVRAVGRNCHGREQCVVDIRNELADFFRPRMHEAKPGPGIAGVAAIFRLRCFLQHHDARGAGLARGDGRLERGAAAADDDDVAMLDARHELFPDFWASRPT